MRILLVSEDIPQPNSGGLAKHVLTLCRALVQRGHQVDILGNSYHPVSPDDPDLQFGGRVFRELNGHFIQWKEPTLGAFLPTRRTWVAKRFARSIMQRAPAYDVIHYHGHFPNLAKFIPAHVNFVQTRHDQGSDCLLDIRFRNGEICAETSPAKCANCRAANPNPVQRTLSAMSVQRYRDEVAEAFSRHKTVFVSQMLHRNLQRTLGQRPWGQVIHHFVDAEKIRGVRNAAMLQPRDRSYFHITVSGKLYSVKGIAAFLHAAVPRLREDMKITVIGDGVDGPALREAYEGEQVRFAGWCDMNKTLEITASADAVVVPSMWEEPFGATTLEGLLLGKPTLALALARGATPELALYASSPDQLRLHPDMDALVTDLLGLEPGTVYPEAAPGAGGPERAVQQLLALYALPPGSIVTRQEEPCAFVSQ